MELTAIEPRRHRLVQLYLDGEAAVKLDAATAQEARLRVGMELDDEELHELLQKSDAARAKEKALYLLEHRPHAKRELERKLSRTVGEEAAQAAADRMEELGLVDDADYAARLAQELARKGYAFSRTVQELVRRGVDRELAQEAAREASPDPEEAIRRLIQRKYERRLGDEKGRRQTAAALQRLGYRWEEIRSALREFDGDPEENLE
ncbi:MAG: regulatory protein RecX [Clostridiales bacterium]|nr:regulatory protein RecX [Clostridiales bacterium]PWM41233.1 MAG: regulatory protein RecX [Clostridiales bacterium]